MNDLILNSKIILGETSEKSKSAILKEYFVIVATGEPIQNGNLVHPILFDNLECLEQKLYKQATEVTSKKKGNI